MIKLLINDISQKPSFNETSFGGLPVKEAGNDTEWPRCKSCKSEMQYQGKIKTDLGLELIFMCQNDPGVCDEWDANSGGNKVIIVKDKKLESFSPKNKRIALRQTEYRGDILEVDAGSYDEARQNWKGNTRDVLGGLYGEPDWVESDDTPNCDCCNERMRFVAQLEEGPDENTAMNFGDAGVGYLFDCSKGKTAKFLWQS